MSKTRPSQPAHDSISADLPEGWALARLPEVANLIMGQSPPGSTYNEDGDGLPFFQGKAEFGDRHPTVRKWCSAPTKIAEAGDVLMSIRAPVGPTNVADRTCAIGRGLAAIRPLAGIPTNFLLYAMRLQENELASQGTGSTFTAINRKHLDAVEVLIPPLAEQKRIVTKVEALLDRVSAARERLARLVENRKDGDRKIPSILKRFRQTVLGAAFSGRLTEDWRNRRPETAPASQLVSEVAHSREADHESACQDAKHANKKPPKPPSNLEIASVPTGELPDIPETWTWVYLPHLGYMNRGKSRHRPRNAPHLYGGPYPFIQTGDIAQSGGRITTHRQTYSEAGLAQSRLWQAGTICITIAANIADSAILTYPACFPDSVVGVIPDKELCVTEYAEYFMRTARDNLAQFAPATAQKNINVQILSDVAVPLAPFYEQREIVNRLDALLRLSGEVERRVTLAMAGSDRLTQAIFAKAFRGELVATEAELSRTAGTRHETGKQLLARIGAEAPAEPKTPRGRMQSTRSSRRSRRIDMRKLSDVTATHLHDILGASKKGMAPEKLLAAADLNVDDFYTQLKREVDAGHVRERRKGKANILLEAVS